MERKVQYDTGNTFFRGLVPPPTGWVLEQPVILIKGFNSSEQQFQTFEPLGLITAPSTPPTPQGWMLEQPVLLIKGFNASEQQVATFEPRGLIPTIPTPQGWMPQSPQYEIFIRGYNSSEQQFSILSFIIFDVLGSLFVLETDDTILSTGVEGGPGTETPASINIGFKDCSNMQILGFSATETLFYDQSDTQAYYLQQIPPAVPNLTVLRVSPFYAKVWMVDSGRPSNWVYNPFGTSPFRVFSNIP